MTLTSPLFLLICAGLIIASALLGWSVGRRQAAHSPGGRNDYSRDYFVGLNYLINDEPDDAIDIFIRSLEANSTTLESHLALGALLRRRGKVDRAISVYQRLLARPGLSEREINQIRVELARSYVSAGLLDRAEKLVEQLQGASSEFRQQGLALAINLYQMERDWENAIKAAEDLLGLCPANERARYQQMASHFHCELAEQEMEAGHFRSVRQALKKAYYLCRTNARVSMLSAQVEMRLENYREAVRALLRVRQQDPEFYPEVFPTLLDCYRRMNSERQLTRFIETSQEEDPSPGVLLSLADDVAREQGSSEALHFLMGHLRNQPSLLLMSRALRILGEEANERERELYLLLHHVLEDYLRQSAAYRCSNCGFEGRMLHWLCPGCSHWGTMRPLQALVSEA